MSHFLKQNCFWKWQIYFFKSGVTNFCNQLKGFLNPPKTKFLNKFRVFMKFANLKKESADKKKSYVKNCNFLHDTLQKLHKFTQNYFWYNHLDCSIDIII